MSLPAPVPRLAVALLATVLVLNLKLFYSNAGPDELDWMLWPTTWLVQAFTAFAFVHEAHKGYVAVDLPVVIGAGCAGLNFLAIALAMCAYCVIMLARRHLLAWFVGLGLLSYAVTVCANAFRIVGALALLAADSRAPLPSFEKLHGAQGALFYFVFLVLYFVAVRAALNHKVSA